MLIILFSIIYAEIIWYLIDSGKRPYESMDTLMKFMVGFNYLLALFVGAKANFIFAMVCSLYQLVIFKYRISEED